MIAPIVLLTAMWFGASQPPTPGVGDKKGQPQTQQASETQPKTEPPRGTTSAPLVVTVARSEEQATEDRQEREDQRANRRQTLGLSVITALVIAFQVFLLIQQNNIMKRQSTIMTEQRAAATKQAEHMADGLLLTRKSLDFARESATTQAADTQASIKEAGRAATAMEGLVKQITANTALIQTSIENSQSVADRQWGIAKAQTRADIVLSGHVVMPQTDTAKTVINLEARNLGPTPAYKVRSVIFGDVLPYPPAAGFTFPARPLIDDGGTLIGAGQHRILTAVFQRLCSVDELLAALEGGGAYKFFVWGEIAYDDLFGDNHTIQFNYNFLYLGPDNWMRYETPGYNKSN